MGDKKVRLSKGILDMKFMKRTKVKIEKEEEEAQAKAMYAGDIGNKVLGESSFIFENCFQVLENLRDGRMSFRGMNHAVERLMEMENAEQLPKSAYKQPTEVSDIEMVEHYDNNDAISATRTMQKKFHSKNMQKKKQYRK